MHATKIHKIQNNKNSKKQKQKTPTKCKSKLSSVEWHKEAADQSSQIAKDKKTQKIQQIQNAKCKLLTVEWHKEAADQRPAHGPASCLAEAPSLVLQLFERGSQNCFHKFCNLVDWDTLSSIKSSRKFSQSFYEASSLTEASNLVK